MGRLSALTVSALLSASGSLGCDKPKGDLPPPPPTSGRAAAVTAAGTAAVPRATTGAPAATPRPGAGPPRQLCVGQTQRPSPKGSVRTAAAPGGAPLPGSIPFGVGKWTWVNLWAAWCGPCKEEMPRLIAWQRKLTASGVLVDLAFVSLDDDERQLQRFLEAQPAEGVRSSYWLPEGSGRSQWLGQLGVKDSPELPVHALVAPSGQIACLIQGAVEDRDYAGILGFLRSTR